MFLFLALECVRRTNFLIVQHPNKYFASANCDEIWHLCVCSRLQPDITFSCIDTFVKSAFNLTNGLLHSVWLFVQPTMIGTDWLTDWRFAMGAAFFGLGFAVNVDSCNRLLRLRRENQGDYSIPRGGLFRWVSCPNYLGEMVEWIGWALLTWNPAGLAFAVWTMANLAPRARAHHYWYRDRFPDYPTKRKALIPGIF